MPLCLVSFLAWGRGNEKGRVERTIRYVRESFFAARDFVTLSRLNQQAWEWRDRVTLARPWPGDDARRVGEIFAEERPRLLPLPAHPFETELVQTIRSRKTIYVHFDLNDYSIPPTHVSRTLTLVASATQVACSMARPKSRGTCVRTTAISA